ncbi:EpsG family protein [Pseudomonas profundi]|uniref:EpsG family protein n=1 Tax=Pseudomonas profundi TaxID=1981513 RepID=UPI00123B6578|nr:EpsG family protein [Pseudomonas profundi]
MHLVASFLLVSVICFFSDLAGRHRRAVNVVILLIAFLILFVPLAVRHESVGIDTLAYYKIFDLIASVSNPYSTLRYELGYTVLNRLVYYFDGRASIVIFVSAAISLVPAFFLLYKYGRSYLMSISILLGMNIYGFMFNGVRQAVAMGVLMLSLHFYLKGRTALFLVFVILATTFHFTAIVFLALLFLDKARIGAKLAVLAWLVSMFFVSPWGAGLLMPYFKFFVPSDYLPYIEGGVTDQGLRVRFLANQLFCLLCIFFINVRESAKIDETGLTLLYLTFYGFLFSNVVSQMGFMDRIPLYFSMFAFISLPYVASCVVNRRSFYLLVGFLFVVFSLFYLRGLSLGSNGMLPYSTIWKL